MKATAQDAEIAALKKQLAELLALTDAKLLALEGQRNEALNRAMHLEAQLRLLQPKGA